jgi:hypothetical protein
LTTPAWRSMHGRKRVIVVIGEVGRWGGGEVDRRRKC